MRTDLSEPLSFTVLVTSDQTMTGRRFVVVSNAKLDGVELGQVSNTCVEFVRMTVSVGDAGGVMVTPTKSLLFAGVASGSEAEEEAVLMALPAAVAVTMIVRLAPVPLFRLPRLAITVPPEFVTLPCEALAETKLTAAGS